MAIDKSIVFIILLAVSNFLLKGTYLVFLSFALMFLFFKKIKLNRISMLLISFSVLYSVSQLIFSSGSLISNMAIFIFPLGYIMGYNLWKKENFSDNLVQNITYIGFAMAFHGILNFFYSYKMGGLSIFSTGRTYDFWSKSMSTATGQASYYYYLGIIAVFLLTSKYFGKKKIFTLLFFGICFLHNLLLGGRTFLALIAIAILINFLFCLFFSNKKGKILKFIFIIFIAILIIFILYSYNLFGVKDIFEESYFYRRFFSKNNYENISETPRWAIKMIYYKNMSVYLFGGNHIRNNLGMNYAHELWLDTYDTAGLMPFVILWIFTIHSIKTSYKIVVSRKLPFEVRGLVLSFITVSLASFFVEPVIEGCPMVFFSFCYILGILDRYLKKRRS